MTTKSFPRLSGPVLLGTFNANSVGHHFFPAALALWCGLITFDQLTDLGRSSTAAQASDRTGQGSAAIETGAVRSSPSKTVLSAPDSSDEQHHLRVAVIEEPPISAPVAAHQGTPVARQLKMTVGDQLKIAVYERLENDENKWSNASERPRKPSMSLQLRTEMSGDYSVQEDGIISLPLLGVFRASERTLEDVKGDITNAFEQTLGRRGFVNVQLAERQPIYVLGPVKNSGIYKFSAGMTAWHGVALAGGFENVPRPAGYLDNRLDATREVGNVQRNSDRVAALVARREVLAAERDKRPVGTPPELADLTGSKAAAALIAGEQTARSLVVAGQKARIVSIRGAIEAAKSEFEAARQRSGQIDVTVKGQGERLATLKTLGAQGLARRPQLLEAELQLSQAQERRAEARVGTSQAEQRIGSAEQELARLVSDATLELDNQIASIERELSEVNGQRRVGLHLLEVLSSSESAQSPAQSGIDRLVQYEIVRRSGETTITIAAKGDTELQPGDLVKLSLPPQSRTAP